MFVSCFIYMFELCVVCGVGFLIGVWMCVYVLDAGLVEMLLVFVWICVDGLQCVGLCLYFVLWGIGVMFKLFCWC